MVEDVLMVALKRCKPVALRALLADNTSRELAPPGGKRKNWKRMVETLDRMPWVQAELLDTTGRVVDVVDNDEPAGELEDLAGVAQTGQVANLLNLMLRAQDMALKRNAEQNSQLATTVLKLADVLMRRLDSLERGYAANLKVAQQFVRQMGDEDEELLSDGPVGALMPLLAAKALGVPPEVMAAMAGAPSPAAKGGGDE